MREQPSFLDVVGAACTLTVADNRLRLSKLSLGQLGALDDLVTHAVRSQDLSRETQAVLREKLDELATLKREDGLIDPEDKLAELLEQSEEGLRTAIALWQKTMALDIVPVDLKEDLQRLIELDKQTHDLMAKLRWEVMEFDADVDDSTDEPTFSSVQDLFEDLKRQV